VFILNAVALVIFPGLGHWMGMDQNAFGLWSALAIHDTSSVVGAALTYGPQALEIATTVKLARALWILPLTLVWAAWAQRKAQGTPGAKPKRPWFILGFVLASALVTFVPPLKPVGKEVATGARHVLVLVLFLIGGGLTRDTLKRVGVKPMFLGLALWIVAATASAGAILAGWVK
jgi:uncharacterized membrane protein YadS